VNRSVLRRGLFVAIVLAFVFRHDIWFWDDPGRVLGLPVGLVYQLLFCLAVAAIFAMLIVVAPPGEPETGSDTDS
jgi:hypothetical protein